MSADSDAIRRKEEREFQVNIARAQIKAGMQNSVGVGFTTTGLAIGATVISLGRIDSFDELVQYGSYFLLMMVLVVIGGSIIGKTKKDSDDLLKKFNGKSENEQPIPSSPTQKDFWWLWRLKWYTQASRGTSQLMQ